MDVRIFFETSPEDGIISENKIPWLEPSQNKRFAHCNNKQRWERRNEQLFFLVLSAAQKKKTLTTANGKKEICQTEKLYFSFFFSPVLFVVLGYTQFSVFFFLKIANLGF